MPKLRYVGGSHYREITKANFKSIGVEDQDKIHVAGRNAKVMLGDHKTPDTVEVSEAAATWLLDFERGDWEVVDESNAPKGATGSKS